MRNNMGLQQMFFVERRSRLEKTVDTALLATLLIIFAVQTFAPCVRSHSVSAEGEKTFALIPYASWIFNGVLTVLEVFLLLRFRIISARIIGMILGLTKSGLPYLRFELLNFLDTLYARVYDYGGTIKADENMNIMFANGQASPPYEMTPLITVIFSLGILALALYALSIIAISREKKKQTGKKEPAAALEGDDDEDTLIL